MNTPYELCPEIDLLVEGRISRHDAQRQQRTAEEILRRLAHQPGVILADEVGMGKTFVALAVAVSVALGNRGQHPVVVMVPPSLKDKWPRDFSLFCERCLPEKLRAKIDPQRKLNPAKDARNVAENAVDFLKLLDDPPERKQAIIFLTHGALHRRLNDEWVMLALIRQSMHRRWNTQDLRRALVKCLGDLLQKNSIGKRNPDIWEQLLARDPGDWLSLLQQELDIDDDPVPQAILDILPKLKLGELYDSLSQIPYRQTQSYHDRVVAARRLLKDQMRQLWGDCLAEMQLRLPLLILDEAHHLKNPQTRMASLFQTQDAEEDAKALHDNKLFEMGLRCVVGICDRFTDAGCSVDQDDPYQVSRSSLRAG